MTLLIISHTLYVANIVKFFNKQIFTMTQEEFSKTGFYGGMPVTYKDETRIVRSVDFMEDLVGLVSKDDQGDIDWVRCENVSLQLPS